MPQFIQFIAAIFLLVKQVSDMQQQSYQFRPPSLRNTKKYSSRNNSPLTDIHPLNLRSNSQHLHQYSALSANRTNKVYSQMQAGNSSIQQFTRITQGRKYQLDTASKYRPIVTFSLKSQHCFHTQTGSSVKKYLLASAPSDQGRTQRATSTVEHLVKQMSKMTSLQQKCNPAISAFSTDMPDLPLSLGSLPTSHSLPSPQQQPGKNKGPQLSDFRKLRELGKGKFGTVWLAMHKATNFLVALKVVKKSTVKEESIMDQLPKELRIHNALTTRYIIAFYGFFFQGQYLYMIGEYATDGHLFQLLKQHHRLEEKEVKKYSREVAEGIDAIHKRGFIHRDIKPENILLQFGQIKIGDFGWATEYYDYEDGENKLKESTVGTPLYYSPQMVKKEGHNGKVDIWALGMLVYELMVGKVPFRVWSEFDLHRIVEEEVVMPDYVDCSRALCQFVSLCLSKEQRERATLRQLLRHDFLREEEESELKWQLYSQLQAILCK